MRVILRRDKSEGAFTNDFTKFWDFFLINECGDLLTGPREVIASFAFFPKDEKKLIKTNQAIIYGNVLHQVILLK